MNGGDRNRGGLEIPRHAGMRRLILLGICAALLSGIPFLGKPFHIDDVHFLSVAERIGTAPLDPYGFEIHWTDDPESIFKTWNPPLLSYWLAPWVAAFGRNEIALHTAVLPFLALFGGAAGALAGRFSRGSPWAALFPVLGPAVLVSGNVMLDIPAAGLGAAAVALVVLGTDRGRRPLVLGGGILAAFALLTKYSSAAILPMIFLYPLIGRGRGRGNAFLAVLPALLLLALWSAQNVVAHGEIHALHLLGRRTGETWIRSPLEKARLGVAALGATFFLAPLLLARDLGDRRWKAAGSAVAAGLIVALGFRGASPGGGGPFSLLATASGGALLFLVFTRGAPAEDRRDRALLLYWAAAPLLFSAFFAPFQAVRHLVPALVPLSLLAFSTGSPRGKGGTFAAALVLAFQAGAGVIVGTADAEQAGVYRTFAREEIPRLDREGVEVWFAGHWGWQHYAEDAGLTAITMSGRGPAL
ncbi:MAG: hypothetical protein ABIH26_02020, partial [Candidatus Eisenbacteria bacterium]